MNQQIRNPHPGIILKEDFLQAYGLSMRKLASAIDVPTNRISEIVKGSRRITADTDLRLSLYFGLSEGFWLRLQNSFDLMEAKRQLKLKGSLKRIKPIIHA
jgi:addiction module HigA family antidote